MGGQILLDDHAIMTRISAGDQAAMGDLYDRYGRQVYSLAIRMLQDAATAEDITQEVFVKVWRNAARFDPERGRLGTWVLHIAYTTTVDLVRVRQRAAPSSYEESADEADPLADPAGDAERTLMGMQVRGALMRLPPEQRQSLELAYFGALTQQEIATQLQIPLGTVKSRIRLGIEALRSLLMLPRRKDGDAHVRLSPR
jgi:RNA polymerase sigma factor (sigma-70 family)